MRKKFYFAISIIATVGCIQQAAAQKSTIKYEAGIGLSGFIYQGDLTPSQLGSYRTLRPGISLWGARMLNPFLSLRGVINLGGLHGNDSKYATPKYRQQRNFSFSSSLLEISVLAIYNFSGNNEYIKLSPYVFAGLGFLFLKTNTDYSGFNASFFGSESWVVSGLGTDIAHGPAQRIPIIPLGAGVRYPISSYLSIAFETNYRLFYTDYLDGFSRSAGASKKDHYYSHSLSLIYAFSNDKSIKCPVIKP